MGRRKVAIAISLMLVLLSIAALAVRGLNFGIDFTGGVLLEAGYAESADLTDVRARLAEAGFADAQVQEFGVATDVLIRLLPRADGNASQLSELGDSILEVLRSGGAAVELRRIEFVGPQVGQELTERGGTAMIFALLMILAYIMFRFQWKFAVGSVVALMHDVIIVLGLFAAFQLPFDLSVLAALLAVIGYSLNDTIVVFDRIRENFRGIRKGVAIEIVNGSINQMLARTIITSLTTLLVLASLFLLGGEAVRGFSTALIAGIFVGTYSSIYTASTTALALNVSPEDLLVPKQEELVDDLP
ncbi:MAG: protein translocase subunit SecF [Gammaproteobacteria bacterium]|nr:protein translocase subunit SecF [Gammaproteobacteria bacterium]